MGTLSYMKIGKKEFYLAVGDRFFTNGSCFIYQPSTSESIRKCGKYNDSYRSTQTIEVPKKYREAILAGECLNVVRFISGQKYHSDECVDYKVLYVDEVKIEKDSLGELWYIGIGIKSESFLSNGSKDELFTFHKEEIKDRTSKQILLKKDLHYCGKWNTEEWLSSVISKASYGSSRLAHGDDFGVFIEVPPNVDETKFTKIEEWKDKLHSALKKKLDSELLHAQNNLAEFNRLATKTGY